MNVQKIKQVDHVELFGSCELCTAADTDYFVIHSIGWESRADRLCGACAYGLSPREPWTIISYDAIRWAALEDNPQRYEQMLRTLNLHIEQADCA